MAKTNDGKKIVTVPPYKRRKQGGERKVVQIPRHRRSTPNK
jgi:hypothetical protein